MTYTPPRELLRGLPLNVAECYGKPNVGARYTGPGVNRTSLEEGVRCACCGRPATNVHHWPPKGRCPSFTLNGVEMRPSLIALCGSGTTGCHDGWHGGSRYTARWEWDCDDAARAWWEEGFCGLAPHDPLLYRFGRWVFEDMLLGTRWEVRL